MDKPDKVFRVTWRGMYEMQLEISAEDEDSAHFIACDMVGQTMEARRQGEDGIKERWLEGTDSLEIAEIEAPKEEDAPSE